MPDLKCCRQKSISVIPLIIFFILLAGCTGGTARSFIPNIPGYSAATKQTIVLDDKLKEISGMFYMNDGKIAAVNDEEGKIFFLGKDGSLDEMKFGGKADYEDIVKVDNFFYVLESNGNLHKVQDGGEGIYQKIIFDKVKKVEFESLYVDSKANKLVMLTKDHNKKIHGIIAYTYDLAAGKFADTPVYIISMRDVYKAVKNMSAECKPSATAIHPITHNLFVLASVGKLLLECNLQGKIEHAFQLNPQQFPQPEGITFAPNGDMYISNEDAIAKATILKFPYNTQPK